MAWVCCCGTGEFLAESVDSAFGTAAMQPAAGRPNDNTWGFRIGRMGQKSGGQNWLLGPIPVCRELAPGANSPRELKQTQHCRSPQPRPPSRCALAEGLTATAQPRTRRRAANGAAQRELTVARPVSAKCPMGLQRQRLGPAPPAMA